MILSLLLAISRVASADQPAAPPDMSDQAIDADLGIASGGRVTPGGFRIAGHYLYQLTDRDWFDGAAAFTFGGGAPACFHDRSNAYICDHGLAQGDEVLIGAAVRHYLGGHGTYWPYVHGGIGVGYARFGADNVGGLAIPLYGGAGIRVSVTPSIAIAAQAEVDLGIGFFSHGVGVEPQLGLDVTAGVEFRL